MAGTNQPCAVARKEVAWAAGQHARTMTNQAAGASTRMMQTNAVYPVDRVGVFTPKISADERAARKDSWAKAVDCSFGWAGRA